MNSADKQAVLHCLKSMIDEEVCEECPLYGTTGTDHCEKDCVRLAINALEKEPKKGQWIKNAEEWQNVDPPYICSECGRASLRQENFCCSCGAKMSEIPTGAEGSEE